MMQTGIDVVRRHYEASARGDLGGMMAAITPRTQWTEMAGFPCAGTYVGADAIIENVFKRIGEEWEGFRFDLEKLIDGGANVVAVGAYAGTCRASGKPMRVRTVHLWQVEDGSIRFFEQFTDTLLVERARS